MSWTATKTWVSGDPWTMPDANKYLRDDANYLKGDSAWLYTSGLNGWVPYGGPTYSGIRYRRIGTKVQCGGLVKQASDPGPGNIFGVPIVWAPPVGLLFLVEGNGKCVRLDVYPDGHVYLSSAVDANYYIHLTLDPLIWSLVP